MDDQNLIDWVVRQAGESKTLPYPPTWSELRCFLTTKCTLLSNDALEKLREQIVDKYMGFKTKQREETEELIRKRLLSTETEPDPDLDGLPPTPARSRAPSNEIGSDQLSGSKKEELFQPSPDEKANVSVGLTFSATICPHFTIVCLIYNRRRRNPV